MQENEIRFIFEKISTLRVGIIGDFAVDFYYDLQKKTEEISLETRQEVWWGSQSRTSLGAAGNVVQNLAALGVGTLKVFGAVGHDIYGREMLHLMQKLGVDTVGIRIQEEGWETCAYTKPLDQGTELNRVDFGTHNQLSDEGFEEILKSLKTQMAHLDVLIINQQFASPLITRKRVDLLNAMATVYPQVYILADMRTYGLALRGMTLKVNTEEMARLLEVAGYESWTTDECTFYGHQLSDQVQGPVLITRGEQGMQYVHQESVHQSTALDLAGALDTVGAGDTAVATYAACAGAQVPILEALALANLASAITVQKISQTGTASQEEILELNKTI